MTNEIKISPKWELLGNIIPMTLLEFVHLVQIYLLESEEDDILNSTTKNDPEERNIYLQNMTISKTVILTYQDLRQRVCKDSKKFKFKMRVVQWDRWMLFFKLLKMICECNLSLSLFLLFLRLLLHLVFCLKYV